MKEKEIQNLKSALDFSFAATAPSHLIAYDEEEKRSEGKTVKRKIREVTNRFLDKGMSRFVGYLTRGILQKQKKTKE